MMGDKAAPPLLSSTSVFPARRETTYSRPARFSVQAPLGRPARELVAVGELELAQHRRDVGLDGLGRAAEAQRDLLVHVAARDVAQDLALARGELVEVGVGVAGARWGGAGEGVEHEPSQARREDGVAA